jgi:hypothetical protein
VTSRSKWTLATTIAGGALTLIGLGGLPDDLRGWGYVASTLNSAVDHNTARWIFCIVGIGLIAAARATPLIRRSPANYAGQERLALAKDYMRRHLENPPKRGRLCTDTVKDWQDEALRLLDEFVTDDVKAQYVVCKVTCVQEDFDNSVASFRKIASRLTVADLRA